VKRVTRDLIYSRNIKGQGHPAALRRDRKSIKSGISSERHTNFKLDVRMEYDDPHHRRARTHTVIIMEAKTFIIDMRSDRQAESSGWLIKACHLQVAAALQAAQRVTEW